MGISLTNLYYLIKADQKISNR